MKVGNLVNDLAVVDVKRVNKLNLIQFLKDVNSYLELGYKIDVNSGRQVGLVLQCDVYKTEEPKPYVDTNGIPPISSDDVLGKSVEDAEQVSVTPEQNDAKVVKTSRTKKTT